MLGLVIGDPQAPRKWLPSSSALALGCPPPGRTHPEQFHELRFIGEVQQDLDAAWARR